MDDSRFDTLARTLVGRRSRRAVLGILTVLGLGGLDAAAKKKHKKRKKKKRKQPSPPCATSCAGCCAGESCRAGTTATACGTDGESCVACDAGEGCQDGSCVALPCGEGGPCLVFVTSTEHFGQLSGLSGADSICQFRAANALPAPLPGTYKAWIATKSEGPDTRFVQSTGPYRLVDGTTIAANWADLTDGTLAAPITITENGNTVGNYYGTWTNVATNGAPAGANDCATWNSSLSAEFGGTGSAISSSSTWTQSQDDYPCGGDRRLYCFQQS